MTLIERGESFYQDMMPGVVAELERKGLNMNMLVLVENSDKFSHPYTA